MSEENILILIQFLYLRLKNDYIEMIELKSSKKEDSLTNEVVKL